MKKYFFVLISCLFVVSCAKHFKVTDPVTEKTYYTKKISARRFGGGGIWLIDGRNGNLVNLHSSEIEKINKDQYELGVKSNERE